MAHVFVSTPPSSKRDCSTKTMLMKAKNTKRAGKRQNFLYMKNLDNGERSTLDFSHRWHQIKGERNGWAIG